MRGDLWQCEQIRHLPSQITWIASSIFEQKEQKAPFAIFQFSLSVFRSTHRYHGKSHDLKRSSRSLLKHDKTMMALNGNRWMQKREVEKRMQLHWKNLEEKTSTGASFRDENPRKSMLNRRDKIVKQREIHQV
jgi:hypothetical protein